MKSAFSVSGKPFQVFSARIKIADCCFVVLLKVNKLNVGGIEDSKGC